jgi:hypothetical protein
MTFREKIPRRLVNPHPLLRREISVLAAGDCQQLIRNVNFVQRFVQANGMRVRDRRICIALNHQNRRQAGSNPQPVARSSGAIDDLQWGDIAWSSDDWILCSVAQNVNGCFKVRPDGSSRTQVSDGGPNCTPPGFEQSGDTDPGWSSDGKTIYSTRGLCHRSPSRRTGPV